MTLNPGKLRHRVTIQRKEQTRDSGGGYIEEWVDQETVWAEVKPLQGRRLIEAQAVNAELSHEVTMRYRLGMLQVAKNRLLYHGRIFEIDSVINIDERKHLLMLTCKEVG